MLKLRKLATALVLGLIMCLALFGTGAFAQGWGGVNVISAHSTAIAGGSGFGSGFGGGCGFGCGNDWLSSFFGPDAVASSNVFVASLGGW